MMSTGSQHNSSLSLWTILLSIMAILFNEPLYTSLTSIGWIETVYKELKPSLNSDILVLVALVTSLLICDNAVQRLRGNAAAKSIAVLLPVLVTVICFRVFHSAEYTPFYLFPGIKYADVPAVVIMLCLYESLANIGKSDKAEQIPDDGNKQQESPGLLFDDNNAKDILGRMASVGRHAELLISDNNKGGAFGVAVTGGWGTGKSWYMSALKSELEKHNATCISFKPWLYSEKELTPTFCKLLDKTLRGNDIDTSDLKALAGDLLMETGSIGKLSSYFIRLHTSTTREELIENIKSELIRHKKPVFVLMDECDRLSKNELLKVFSLIRNICDFPYICYILSYDKQKIDIILKDAGGLEYAAKMIDITINLENISNAVIKDKLSKEFNSKLNKENIAESFESIDFSKYLPTLRQFKRFWNQLFRDYKDQQVIFDKLFLCTSDWIILELIKYRNNKLYSILRDEPGKILSTANDSWNSPSWVYEDKVDSDFSEYKPLLKFLFPKEVELSNNEKVYGVANKSWKQAYFVNTLPKGFHDCHEYVNCHENKTFAANVLSWTKRKDNGLIYVIAGSLEYLSYPEILKCLVDYIWASCDTASYIQSLGNQYSKNDIPHSYWFIQNFVTRNPLLTKALFQLIPPSEKSDEKILDDFVDKIERILELTALMLSLLRNSTSSDDVEYWYIKAYIPILFNRILSNDKKSKKDTLDILEILFDCTLENTFEDLVLPLVKEDPKRWLGATITIDKVGDDNEFLLLNSRYSHALFGKKDNCIPFLDKVLNVSEEENKTFVEDYISLFKNLRENIQLAYDQRGIPNFYIRPDLLNKDNYPNLISALYEPNLAFIPIGSAIAQLAGTPFWKGDDLRIVRKESGFYFSTEL